MDLINDKCFLELDRFDKKVFNFSGKTQKLLKFVLRTGKSQFRYIERELEENRYQALKWKMNQSLVFQATHKVDLNKIKQHLTEIFPFLGKRLSAAKSKHKIETLS